jgi:hypothetical protein
MKLRTVLFLGIIIVSASLIAYSRVPTLENELYWYQSKGYSIYSFKYSDFLDELPTNRTLSENKVSRLSLRQYVPMHDGIVYYCSDLEILFCFEVPESGRWVYVYFNEIESWNSYWHIETDPIRDKYGII